MTEYVQQPARWSDSDKCDADRVVASVSGTLWERSWNACWRHWQHWQHDDSLIPGPLRSSRPSMT